MRNWTRILYTLALIGVLALFTNCNCEDDSPNPNSSWVTCQNGQPVITDGHNTSSTSTPKFDLSKYQCPQPTGSPIWANSQKPVYGGSGGSGKSGGSAKLRAAAASASTAQYLRRTILALPFLPLSWSQSTDSPPCDASFPDVLQVHHDNALVTRFSTCPFAIQTTIPVATRPLQIAITPDGQTALVTSFDNAVNFIDLATNKVTFTLNTGDAINPNGVAISSDGAHAYITSFNDTNPVVAIIDMASRKVTGTIAVDIYPQSVYVTPDDSQLYVTFPFTDEVFIFDTLTNTVAITLNIFSPRDIAFNSKGTKAYITSAAGSPGTVQELNMNTFKVDTVYKVGIGPTDIAVLYGDAFVVVNNYEGKSVSSIKVTTGAVTTTPMTGSPIGLSIVR